MSRFLKLAFVTFFAALFLLGPAARNSLKADDFDADATRLLETYWRLVRLDPKVAEEHFQESLYQTLSQISDSTKAIDLLRALIGQSQVAHMLDNRKPIPAFLGRPIKFSQGTFGALPNRPANPGQPPLEDGLPNLPPGGVTIVPPQVLPPRVIRKNKFHRPPPPQVKPGEIEQKDVPRFEFKQSQGDNFKFKFEPTKQPNRPGKARPPKVRAQTPSDKSPQESKDEQESEEQPDEPEIIRPQVVQPGVPGEPEQPQAPKFEFEESSPGDFGSGVMPSPNQSAHEDYLRNMFGTGAADKGQKQEIDEELETLLELEESATKAGKAQSKNTPAQPKPIIVSPTKRALPPKVIRKPKFHQPPVPQVQPSEQRDAPPFSFKYSNGNEFKFEFGSPESPAGTNENSPFSGRPIVRFPLKIPTDPHTGPVAAADGPNGEAVRILQAIEDALQGQVAAQNGTVFLMPGVNINGMVFEDPTMTAGTLDDIFSGGLSNTFGGHGIGVGGPQVGGGLDRAARFDGGGGLTGRGP